LSADAYWLGLALLSLIFLANAFGILDQSRAIRELASAGLPFGLGRFAGGMIGAGRLLQLAMVPALFFSGTRTIAALTLSAVLAGATPTARACWCAKPGERDPQLVKFLKNVGLIGGLLIVAAGGVSHE